jgi:hypothetical protein
MLHQAFNNETVEQGRAVGRITALAFIFIPLSFVAVHTPFNLFLIIHIFHNLFSVALLQPCANSESEYIRHD